MIFCFEKFLVLYFSLDSCLEKLEFDSLVQWCFIVIVFIWMQFQLLILCCLIGQLRRLRCVYFMWLRYCFRVFKGLCKVFDI